MQPWLFCNFLPEEQLSNCFEIKIHKCWKRQAGNWPHQSSVLVLVRHFPARRVWVLPFSEGQEERKSWFLRTEMFCIKHIIFPKSFLGIIFLLSLGLMDKNWLGKDPSIASSPVFSTFPGDVDWHHVIQGGFSWLQIKQSKDLTQSSAATANTPTLGSSSLLFFVKSEPIQEEQLCSAHWSHSRNCFRPWTWTLVSYTLWKYPHVLACCELNLFAHLLFLQQKPYFHFDEAKTLKHPLFS